MRFGRVCKVYVPRNLGGSMNCGFAFLTFVYAVDARDFFSVYQDRGLLLKKQNIRVSWATGTRQTPSAMIKKRL